jgi:hypothetical protein
MLTLRRISIAFFTLAPALVAAACSSSNSTGGVIATDGGDDSTASDAGSQGGGDGTVTSPEDGGGADVASGSEGGTGDSSSETGAVDATGGSEVDGGDGSIASEASSEAAAVDGPADSGVDGADGDTAVEAGSEAGATDAEVDDADSASLGEGGVPADAGDGGACNALVNSAPVVVSTIAGGGLPTMTGGALVSGTYYLTGDFVYPAVDGGSDSPGLGSTQETVVLSGTMASVAIASSGSTDGGVGVTNYLTETLAPSGASLSISVDCGAWSGGTFPYTSGTSDAGAVTISIEMGNSLLVLTKQ